MRLSPRISHKTQLHLLLLPYSVGIVVLVILPSLLAFGLAFFQFDGLSPPRWVGDLNFVLAYTDELFKLSVRNSLALIILPVPMRVLGALLVARLLQRGGRFLAWYRAAVYLPSVIPTTAFALAWLWILNPLSGPMNLALEAFNVPGPAWLVDGRWAIPGIILMSLWQIGEGFLVSLAALQDIPIELEEAAKIDGASPRQAFWLVAMPIIAPILLLLIFRDAILTFQTAFTTIQLTTGGGPYYATYSLPQFIYEQGFDLLAFGQASAALWALYGLTGLIVVALYLIARSWQIGTTDEILVI